MDSIKDKFRQSIVAEQCTLILTKIGILTPDLLPDKVKVHLFKNCVLSYYEFHPELLLKGDFPYKITDQILDENHEELMKIPYKKDFMVLIHQFLDDRNFVKVLLDDMMERNNDYHYHCGYILAHIIHLVNRF